MVGFRRWASSGGKLILNGRRSSDANDSPNNTSGTVHAASVSSTASDGPVDRIMVTFAYEVALIEFDEGSIDKPASSCPTNANCLENPETQLLLTLSRCATCSVTAIRSLSVRSRSNDAAVHALHVTGEHHNTNNFDESPSPTGIAVMALAMVLALSGSAYTSALLVPRLAAFLVPANQQLPLPTRDNQTRFPQKRSNKLPFVSYPIHIDTCRTNIGHAA